MEILSLWFGAWSSGEGSIVGVRNPYTGERLGELRNVDVDTIARVVARMDADRHVVGALPVWQRSALLERTAELLGEQSAPLIEALVIEGGKPRREARIEVSRAVECFRLTASALANMSGTMVPMSASAAADGRLGFEFQVPAGLAIAIAPFNAPLNLIATKVAAALGAGCPVIAKPPVECPSVSNILARAVLEAGWPESAIAVLHGGAEVGAALVSAPEPRVVAFTGSVAAGKAITRIAGIKTLVLELGSTAATIVCDDADFDDAVERLMRGAFGSAGQACISTQRLLVQDTVAEAFGESFVAATRRLKVGDPSDPEVDVGPVIHEGALQRIMHRIQEAKAMGALVRTGGEHIGNCISPTVIDNVAQHWPIVQDEIFGPVVALQTFSTIAEACALANDSRYGLQAGVFTRNIDRAIDFAEKLEFGSVQINETSRVRHDLHAFGGMKQSGIGREGIQHLLRAMTETKFVGVRRAH